MEVGRAGAEVDMPGNSERSADQRVVGSLMRPPPRHWRTKAKAARVSGRTVSNKRILEVKICEEEDDDDDDNNDDNEEEVVEVEVGRSDEWRPGIVVRSKKK